jgi:hypothetical protein
MKVVAEEALRRRCGDSYDDFEQALQMADQTNLVTSRGVHAISTAF